MSDKLTSEEIERELKRIESVIPNMNDGAKITCRRLVSLCRCLAARIDAHAAYSDETPLEIEYLPIVGFVWIPALAIWHLGELDFEPATNDWTLAERYPLKVLPKTRGQLALLLAGLGIGATK